LETIDALDKDGVAWDSGDYAYSAMHPNVHQGLDAYRRMQQNGVRDPQEALCLLGAQISSRAEEIAGTTSEEIRLRNHELMKETESRLEEAAQRYREVTAERDRLLDEVYARRKVEVDAAYDQDADVGPVFDKYRPEISAIFDSYGPRANEANSAQSKARVAHHQATYAQDEQTKQDLRRLADGYVAALSEVREMGGGGLVYHDRSAARARRVFDEALCVFPDDWVQASNEAIGKQVEAENIWGPVKVESGAPLVKISKRRAHYINVKDHEFRKRGTNRGIHSVHESHAQRIRELGRSDSPQWEYEELSPDEIEEHSLLNRGSHSAFWATRHDVRFGPDRPSGKNWEQW